MAAAAESTIMHQQQSIPSSDLGENGGGGIDSLLPRVVIGPDENGVRKVIQYRCDDEGNTFKVVTTITPVSKLARAPTTRNSIKRNPMPSSADAMEEDAKSRLTNVSTNERPHFSGNKSQERDLPIVPMECLICCSKGHHWTIKCPSRVQATVVRSPIADGPSPPIVPMECLICRSKGHHWTIKCPSRVQATVVRSPTADGPSPPREAIKRAYRVRRADRIRDDVKRIMNDDRCVRVTNLSKEAREHRLIALFCIYGFVTHAYIPVDENGSSRGVGYVKFARRREAESAIRNLNGWVFENLTLQVGWAAPRRN